MSRYPLNLPDQLKKDAQEVAGNQGVSLNQLILWAVAEKVTELRRGLDDPRFPAVTYRRGAAGVPVAVLQGTGIRVSALYIAHRDWDLSVAEVAEQYGLGEDQVREALEFAETHSGEMEVAIAADREPTSGRG